MPIFDERDYFEMGSIDLYKDITGDFLQTNGAVKINNSMYRLGDHTFQSHCNLSRLFNLEKHYQGFKVCYRGKFLKNIYFEHELEELLK